MEQPLFLRAPTARLAPGLLSEIERRPVAAVLAAAAGVWLVSRAALTLLTALAAAFSVHPPGFYGALAVWQEYDAIWYLNIAAGGYFNQQSTAFFPLYPLLVHGISQATGLPTLAAGLLTSNVAALAAFAGVGVLAWQLTHDVATARRTLWILAAYPMAMYLAAPYSDSLFLALAAWSLVALRSRRLLASGALLVAAGLCRPTAAALVVPAAIEGYNWVAGDQRVRSLRAVLLGALPVTGTAAYCGYLWLMFGSPFLAFAAQRIYWHRVALPPWQTLALIAERLPKESFAELWDLLPLLVVVAVTLAGLRRRPLALNFFLLALIATAVATPITYGGDAVGSAGRFMLAAIPAFVTVAAWCRRRPYALGTLIAGSAGVQVVATGLLLLGMAAPH